MGTNVKHRDTFYIYHHPIWLIMSAQEPVPEKKMLSEKFLKDPPVKVSPPDRKSQETFEDPLFKFENYATMVFLYF